MTRRPLTIICPLLPPMRGGLPDHTAKLALELNKWYDVTVVSSTSAVPQPGFHVAPSIENWGDIDSLGRALAQTDSRATLVWQYVPHMYGRGGVNRALPGLMQKLKSQGRKQVVIAHEIAAGLSWRPHWLWFALNHRWQWRRLVEAADAVPISTERWVEIWRARLPNAARKFSVLPSPSSIPLQQVFEGHATAWRTERNLPKGTRIMTYFGTVSPAKQLPWVTAAWEAAQTPQRPTALVIIGASPAIPVPAGLEPCYLPLGFLSAPEVSLALSATDVLCLPFIDGVSERRTTLMAGLDHGISISGTYGHNTGTTLKTASYLTLCDAHDRDGFIAQSLNLIQNDSVRADRATAGKRAHDRSYSWDRITTTLGGLIEAHLPAW